MKLSRSLWFMYLAIWGAICVHAENISFCGFSIEYPSIIDSVSVGLNQRGDTMLFLATDKAGFRHNELIINVSRSTANHDLTPQQWQHQLERELSKMDLKVRQEDKRLKGNGMHRDRRQYPNAHIAYSARLNVAPCYYYIELRVLNDCLLTICISAHDAIAYPVLLHSLKTLHY